MPELRENTEPTDASRLFSYGLIFWSVFCILIVLARGLRWDEHYEFAEVILGTVPYPEEHPLGLSLHFMHNIFIYLTTAIVWMFPGPEVICGFRNTAWLLGLLLPLYLMGNSLSGKPGVGHVAVLLGLFGIYLEFDSNYALHNWPGYFSNGHIGRSAAFMLLWSFLAGHRRAAFLLLGFMPAIHPVHMLPALLLISCRVLWDVRVSEDRVKTLRPALWVIPGVVVCVFLWASPWTSPLSMPTEGPYFSEVDGTKIMQGFLLNDPHRAMPGTIIPITNPMFILAATLLLCIGRVLGIAKAERGASIWTWLTIYLGIVVAIVWGIMLLHLMLGADVPSILIGWMPYRFSNHAAILCLAILPAVLLEKAGAGEPKTWYWTIALSALILFEIVKPIFPIVIGEELFLRYFADGAVTLFALFGLGAARISSRISGVRKHRVIWSNVIFICIVVLLNFHQFGAVVLFVSFFSSKIVRFIQEASDKKLPVSSRHLDFALSSLLIVATIQISHHEFRNRIHLYQTDFERDVQAYFEDTGQTDEIVVARPEQRGLQARIHQPVLIDDAIHTGIPYIVHLAPMIQKINHDWYNIRFYPPLPEGAQGWTSLWESRKPADWIVLSDEYDINYIISPNTVPLQLPVVIEGDMDTLYGIRPKSSL